QACGPPVRGLASESNNITPQACGLTLEDRGRRSRDLIAACVVAAEAIRSHRWLSGRFMLDLALVFLASHFGPSFKASRQLPWYCLLNQMAEFPWNKPTPHNWRSFHPEGENHEDASCCCHSCDGDRSPRSGEGEAGAIGAPAGLSVLGATRLLPRLP